MPRSGAVARVVVIVIDVGERPVRGEEHSRVLDELKHLDALCGVRCVVSAATRCFTLQLDLSRLPITWDLWEWLARLSIRIPR